MKTVVGYTVGVYDMFHVGHLHHLEAARADCGELIVGVVGDDDAERRHGLRPFVPMAERMAVLAHLRCVESVVPARGEGHPRPDLGAAWLDLRYDVVYLDSDRNAPFEAVLPAAVAARVRVVDLPDGGDTASELLRGVLDRRAARGAVA